MRKVMFLVAAALSALLANAVSAQVKPEKVIEYRQSVMTVVGWNFGPMAAMMKGDKPYDKETFARGAAIVAYMTPLAIEGFTPGSDKGAETAAKPEIWTKMDDFKAKMDKLNTETAKLAMIAKTGTFDEIKKQFGATGGACKSCHDDFRVKK
ncbi:MAG TPA: cytochrome c [Usitatibacteraceae bacterium]